MVRKKDLQTIAANFGLRGWRKMKKDELVDFLNNYMFSRPISTFEWMRKKDLQDLARQNHLRGWSRMKKADLRKFLEDQNIKRTNFQAEKPFRSEVEIRATAMKGFYKEFSIEGRARELPRKFFKRIRKKIVSLIKREKLTKVKLMLNCLLSKTNRESGGYIEVNPTFLSKNKVNLEASNAFEIFDEMVEEVMVNMANYQKEGSNLQFERVNELVIPFAKFKPLGGSSYVPLPPGMASKKAIVNMKNDDEECFKWSVTRALNPAECHQERVTDELRRQSEKLDWSGLSFPTTLQQIDIFERKNKVNIFVFGIADGFVCPLRKPKQNDEGRRVIDLILLTFMIEEKQKTHYCWIKNLSRLLDSQVTKKKAEYQICRNCLNYFAPEKLAVHQESCLSFDAVKIQMPPEGSTMKFRNYNRNMEFPYVLYADFEARLEKVATAAPSPSKSFTQTIQKHKPVSFCIHLVSDYWKPRPILYRAKNDDEDIGKKFVEVLRDFLKTLHEKTPQKPMEFDRKDAEKFKSATHCFICKEPFEGTKNKVRDHCHFTGKFRGAAHSKCNLLFRVPNFVPVFLHNLKNYDAHFIVKALGTVPGDTKCIANNEEKYISFSKKFKVGEKIVKDEVKPKWMEARFLDSAGFMNTSLANLVKNLDDENFAQTKKVFKDKWKLFQRKGVFPYEWLDSTEKFKETSLPEKEAFFSQLVGKGISDDEWEHANRVWTEMGMKNMGEYHDAYLKADVTELADVMEEFRKVCRTNYGLDPAWYYTAPGLAWDSALKTSQVELELLNDPEMLLFYERGIRGGVSTIFHRRAQANNKYMKDFDKTKPSVFVPYWDANGLYAWAMSQPFASW